MQQYVLATAVALASAAATATCSAQTSRPGDSQTLLVMTASEDAEGAKQSDFSPQLLKILEKKTVESIRAKAQTHLKSTGQPTVLPPFQAESHYVGIGGVKLAVVRIKVPATVNQVIVFGIRETELHRVACIRTSEFDLAIPLFSGPCGDKIREVFGVSVPAK